MVVPVVLLSVAILAQDKPPEPLTVKKVLSATLAIEKGTLSVLAVGEVPTGGWTKATLTRVTYVKQPEDGIQDYTLRATPPSGPATQVISQVKANDTWPELPAWVKGVRIHGAGDGVLVKMIEKK